MASHREVPVVGFIVNGVVYRLIDITGLKTVLHINYIDEKRRVVTLAEVDLQKNCIREGVLKVPLPERVNVDAISASIDSRVLTHRVRLVLLRESPLSCDTLNTVAMSIGCLYDASYGSSAKRLRRYLAMQDDYAETIVYCHVVPILLAESSAGVGAGGATAALTAPRK